MFVVCALRTVSGVRADLMKSQRGSIRHNILNTSTKTHIKLYLINRMEETTF